MSIESKVQLLREELEMLRHTLKWRKAMKNTSSQEMRKANLTLLAFQLGTIRSMTENLKLLKDELIPEYDNIKTIYDINELNKEPSK